MSCQGVTLQSWVESFLVTAFATLPRHWRAWQGLQKREDWRRSENPDKWQWPFLPPWPVSQPRQQSSEKAKIVKVFSLMLTSWWTCFRTWSCLVRLFRNLLSLLPIRSLPWPEPGETLAGRQSLPFLLIACPLSSCNIVWQQVQSKDGHWIVLPWLYQLSCQHVKSVLSDWSDKKYVSLSHDVRQTLANNLFPSPLSPLHSALHVWKRK